LKLPARYLRFVDFFLLLVIALGLILAVAAIAGLGFHTSFLGIRLSSRTFFRPFVIAVVAALVSLHFFKQREEQLLRLWETIHRRAPFVAACLAVLASVIAFRISAFEANAADQYGYVSQAALWAKGNLVIHEPLAAVAPWPEPAWSLSPLGYRPGLEPATIVPTYPPGLPLVMAGLIKLVGPRGVYLAVPLLGSLAIALTFVLGRRLAGATCGLMAAMLLLCSPIFLFQLKEPMSDVPVTAWWLLAIALVIRQTGSSVLGGGLAASAAILTRPNLVPVAVVLGLFLLVDSSSPFRARLRNASLFTAGVVPGCLAVALIHQTLYGSPLRSGYGSMDGLFGLQYFRANLSQFPRWLIETETPFICLAAAIPWLLPNGRTGLPRRSAKREGGLFLALSVTVFVCYAFYMPFDNWTFLRFLLPAVPLLLVASSGAALAIFHRLESIPIRMLLAVLFFVLIAWRWDSTVARGFQPIRGYDRRFEVIGEFVRDELPPNAIVLAIIHSGSVRHYSGRMTLRWDWLPPEWLDPAMTFLKSRGYRPYLLIEEWERPQFIDRFDGRSSLAALDWPPFATYFHKGGTQADIFDLDARSRFLAGERMNSKAIQLKPD
jgi:hypothetical protein